MRKKLLFIVMVVVAEIPAMALFRLSKKSIRARGEVMEECDRRGITILSMQRNGRKIAVK